jgi:hypothetical protein
MIIVLRRLSVGKKGYLYLRANSFKVSFTIYLHYAFVKVVNNV